MIETSTKARVRFIFLTILLDAMGIGILVPVMPDIFRRFSSDHGEISRRYGRRRILLIS